VLTTEVGREALERTTSEWHFGSLLIQTLMIPGQNIM